MTTMLRAVVRVLLFVAIVQCPLGKSHPLTPTRQRLTESFLRKMHLPCSSARSECQYAAVLRAECGRHLSPTF